MYLIYFACYKPTENLKISRQAFMDHIRSIGKFNEASLEFQGKAIKRSDMGEETYLPPAVIANPPIATMKEARAEAEMVMFSAIDELFEKTKVRPKDIGVLVVNCGLFNPMPSLFAMVINHDKMKGEKLYIHYLPHKGFI